MTNNTSKHTFCICSGSVLLINMGKIIYDSIKMSNYTKKISDKFQDINLEK